MRHFILRRAYLVIVLYICLSSAFFELMYKKQKGNKFESFGPLPIVFSIGRGLKQKEIGNKIFYKLKGADEEKELVFNKKFYDSLGGPHHYRLLFMLKLKRAKYVFRSSFPEFLAKSLCDKKIKPFTNVDFQYIKVTLEENKDYIMVWCKK